MARTRATIKIQKAKGPVATKIGSAGGFTPWAPGLPPAGTYDPAIDQSLDSALRGNQYSQGMQQGVQGIGSTDTGDLDVAQRRAEENFGIGLENIARTRGRTLSDMDLALARLANRQKQAFAAAGLQGGGVQQALEARRANDAYQRNRVFEDYGNPATQGDYGLQGRNLQLDLTRGTEDRTTQAGRAQTELTAFQAGGRNSAWAQAKQNNPYLTEPLKPTNEHTVNGQTYRLVRPKSGKYKGVVVKLLPSGKKVPRSDMTTIS